MTCLYSGRGLRRPRREHSRTTAGRSLGARRPATAFASLRSPQAAPRVTLHTALSQCFYVVRRSRASANCTVLKSRRLTISGKTYLRRLRGSHQRCEPPKITPLRGAGVRAVACGPRDPKESPLSLYYTLPFVQTKGNTNRRQAESNHACMNCRGAKKGNKRSTVKNRRGETISGSATAPAPNRMLRIFENQKFAYADVFSPRQSPNKFGSALSLSKTFSDS